MGQALSRRRAAVALAALFLTYALSFADRTAISVLQEPLKREFGLSDWQLGLLSGPAFAVLYALMSLPVARLAERYNRSLILALCVAAWSLMTSLCGLARNFTQLLVARIGVSIGEAGGNPTAHSLIADLFPPGVRARAISLYTLGVPFGAFFGAASAGWLATRYGWRGAFLALGPIGFALTVAVLVMIPKVGRGTFDAPPRGDAVPSAGEVIRFLAGNRPFRHFVAGGALVVMVGYGIAAFLPSYFIRVYGLSYQKVGLVAGLINGIAAGAGTLISGFLADRFGARDVRLYGTMPAVAVLAAMFCFVIGFSARILWISIVFQMLGTMGIYAYIAPTFAQLHNMVEARMRATTASIYYMVINLVGLGLGPPLIGAVSDFVMGLGGAANPAASGLTAGLNAVSLVLIGGAIQFWLAGRALASPSVGSEPI